MIETLSATSPEPGRSAAALVLLLPTEAAQAEGWPI